MIDAKARAALGRTIEAKVAQGYRIESQTPEQAVLVRTSRRWFGLFGGGETREAASINQWGHPSIQEL